MSEGGEERVGEVGLMRLRDEVKGGKEGGRKEENKTSWRSDCPRARDDPSSSLLSGPCCVRQ